MLHELFDNPSPGKSFHPSERIDHSAEPTFDEDDDADADADTDEDGDDNDDTLDHDSDANANSHLDDARIVWQGHVHSGWNLSPGMRDKPSKPDLVSLSVSFFCIVISPVVKIAEFKSEY